MKPFIYLLLITLAFQVTTSRFTDGFQEDNECEKLGGMLINHIITKEPLPEEYEDAYKLLKFSGSGLNDLGDYYACNALSYAHFFTIIIGLGEKGTTKQSIGLCYLKACDGVYIQNALYDLYDKISEKVPLPLLKKNIVVEIPSEELKKTHSKYFIGVLIILFLLAVMIGLMLVGSITKMRLLYPFDIEKNAAAIFNVKNPNQTYAHLRIFDGIRFFSAGWVVFGHSCFMPMIYGAKNQLDASYFLVSWYAPFLTSAYFAVDVFFYMSGFLFYFSVQKLFNQSFPKLKLLFMSVLGRYCRLLPFLIFGVFGTTCLLPYLSNGPNSSHVTSFNAGCEKYWYHNFLYINNMITYDSSGPNEKMCMGHSWYLACDMQFFLYSLAIAIVFNNHKTIQHIIYFFTLVFSIEWQYVQIYKHDYGFNDMLHPNRSSDNYFNDYYIHPCARIGPYILGIYFCELFLQTELYIKDYNPTVEEGPLIRKTLSNTTSDAPANQVRGDNYDEDDELNIDYSNEPYLFQINKFIQRSHIASWSIFAISLTCIGLSFWTSNYGNKYLLSTYWSATMNTWSKMVFIIGLGLLIHLTFLDRFNFIRKFLTFKMETAVSRSTYGIYVVHIYYCALFTLAYNTYYYIRFYDLLLLAVGIFSFSWLTAFVIGLIIESPIIVICKIFIRGEDSLMNTKPKPKVEVIKTDDEEKAKDTKATA